MIMKIRILKKYGDLRPGDILKIECDNNRIPIDYFWRRRIKESFIDKSLVILEEKSNLKDNKTKFISTKKKKAIKDLEKNYDNSKKA